VNILKRSKIIAILGIILSLGTIFIILSLNIRPYLSVTQVLTDPSRYDNQEIQIIGTVQGFSGENFNLTENDASIFILTADISIPSELRNGVKVVVMGIFDSSLILAAIQILTQCS